jgi:hypothetical protein
VHPTRRVRTPGGGTGTERNPAASDRDVPTPEPAHRQTGERAREQGQRGERDDGEVLGRHGGRPCRATIPVSPLTAAAPIPLPTPAAVSSTAAAVAATDSPAASRRRRSGPADRSSSSRPEMSSPRSRSSEPTVQAAAHSP